jgi:hypothetical protein
MQQIAIVCQASLAFSLLTTTAKKGSLLGVKRDKGCHTHRAAYFLATLQWQEFLLDSCLPLEVYSSTLRIRRRKRMI